MSSSVQHSAHHPMTAGCTNNDLMLLASESLLMLRAVNHADTPF